MTQSLIERLQAASGGVRSLDGDIHCAVHGWEKRWNEMLNANQYWREEKWIGLGSIPKYTASIDVAMTLLEPDWFFHVSRFSPECDGRGRAHVYPNRNVGDDYEAEAATPALAICIAALLARESTP